MINYNESDLKQAAQSNGDEWGKVKEEFRALERLINELQKERNARRYTEINEENKKNLKALKPFAQLFYNRNSIGSKLQYGMTLTKIKDGRDYMLCQSNSGKWRIPYRDLTIIEPSQSQINTNRNLVKLLS